MIVVSIILLLILSPLMLSIALLVKLTSKGPIIYRQARVGLRGRQFDLYKFRTMVRGADKILKKKNMDQVLKSTCETIEAYLFGSLYKRGLLVQALEESDWRHDPEKLKILGGRRQSRNTSAPGSTSARNRSSGSAMRSSRSSKS
jgi:hypothetical protein